MNKDSILATVRAKSPWVSHLNAGSCNGCDIEIVAALTPRYDIERFGIVLHGSPRHADILLATGPITRNIAPRMRRIYAQMSDPKFVMAIGQCACTGAVFEECYNTLGGIDKILPVAMYVPGCPPRPEAIAYGAYLVVVSLLGMAAEAKNKGRQPPAEETEEIAEEVAA